MAKHFNRRTNIQEVKRKWNPKLSLRENAKALKISYDNAIAYRIKYGLRVKLNKARFLEKLQNKKIIKFLLKRRFTLEAVGRLYSISRQRVQQILTEK